NRGRGAERRAHAPDGQDQDRRRGRIGRRRGGAPARGRARRLDVTARLRRRAAHRDGRAEASLAVDLSVLTPLRRGRWASGLWSRPYRSLPAIRRVRGSHPQGREACGSSDPATGEVPARRQPQDGACAQAGAARRPRPALGPRDRMIKILEPGPLTTIKDAGRVGHLRYAIPPSGPVDRHAFVIANRLVGNDDGAAALECTLMGPRFEARATCAIAVTGAAMPLTVNGAEAPSW